MSKVIHFVHDLQDQACASSAWRPRAVFDFLILIDLFYRHVINIIIFDNVMVSYCR